MEIKRSQNKSPCKQHQTGLHCRTLCLEKNTDVKHRLYMNKFENVCNIDNLWSKKKKPIVPFISCYSSPESQPIIRPHLVSHLNSFSIFPKELASEDLSSILRNHLWTKLQRHTKATHKPRPFLDKHLQLVQLNFYFRKQLKK